MAWWGTFIGGTLGYVFGGPLGAIIGAALGGNLDRGIKIGDQLGADAFLGEHLEQQRVVHPRVDDVDLVPLAEDVRRHLRVPVTGLMTEMHASLKHLAHGNAAHE